MKNLRLTRKERGITLTSIEIQTGISHVTLSQYENGKQSPGELSRKRLELFFGEQINWLDVKINIDPREPACTWNDCEREFRYFIHQVASLPADEQEVFIKTVCKILNQLK